MSDFNSFNGNQNDQFGSTPNDPNNFGGQGTYNDPSAFGGNIGGAPNNGFNGNNGLGAQDVNGGNLGGGYVGNNMAYNQGQPTGTEDMNVSLWKTLSIVQIIVGCCSGLIPAICGIVSLIFMNKANSALLINDLINAKSNYKTGKIFNILGWIIIVLSILGGIIGALTGVVEWAISLGGN